MQILVDTNIDLNRILLSNDPTVCWNYLHQSLVSIAEQIIP